MKVCSSLGNTRTWLKICNFSFCHQMPQLVNLLAIFSKLTSKCSFFGRVGGRVGFFVEWGKSGRKSGIFCWVGEEWEFLLSGRKSRIFGRVVGRVGFFVEWEEERDFFVELEEEWDFLMSGRKSGISCWVGGKEEFFYWVGGRVGFFVECEEERNFSIEWEEEWDFLVEWE